jgi:hypothetical protein
VPLTEKEDKGKLKKFTQGLVARGKGARWYEY